MLQYNSYPNRFTRYEKGVRLMLHHSSNFNLF